MRWKLLWILTFAAVSGGVSAATSESVNGQVTTITSQLPSYTVVIVGGRSVRFCDPETGVDYVFSADNAQFDLLKNALLYAKSVQVGVQNFGKDSSGSDKLCIERVVLSN